MSNSAISNFHFKTCNNILRHLYVSAKNISVIEIETGIEMATESDNEKHFDSCLNYLIAQEMIVKINEEGYGIIKKGKHFYQNGGFS